MIKFPCHCGNPFELTDDMAGGLIQCPKCGRLNDVPTMDELQSLSPDGTVRLDEYDVKPTAIPTAELHRYYAKGKVDERGEDLDLRTSLEELRRVGADPLKGEEPPQRVAALKYDPVTGELIRPLDLVHDPEKEIRPADIPMAQTTLQYASVELNNVPSILRGPVISLLKLENLAAMLFVLLAHLVILVCLLILHLMPVWFFAWLPVVLVCGLIAHYANVVEDIGPMQKDEVPRFMRDFSAYDDILRPMFNIFLAIIYCFGPLLAINRFVHAPDYVKTLLWFGYAFLSVAMFPAVLMTAVTSGTIYNLRPDRVWRTIGVIGFKYIFILFMGIVATALYFSGIVATANWAAATADLSHKISVNGGEAGAGFLFLLAGIVLMHYWCWTLGLVYRQKQPQFPWILQRHFREENRFLGPRSKPKTATARRSAGGTGSAGESGRGVGAEGRGSGNSQRRPPTPQPVRNSNLGGGGGDSFDGKL